MDKLRQRTASLFVRGQRRKQQQGEAATNGQQQVVKCESAINECQAPNINKNANQYDKSASASANEKCADQEAPTTTDGANTSAPLRGCLTPATRSRLATLTQIGEDWLYLALLGIIMALLSFSMDSIITLFLNTRLWLAQQASDSNMFVQYLAWCVMPILLVTFSTGFVHLCSPTAIGSGIPEMKTILRGIVLNEYLTFRTLIAKIVGLTFTLGSGLPLGKEGPSVHMASIVATLLSKLVASFQGIYENESRTSEMLSAACAVGVAATFYAPIGGVLFSIEVTTVYFAVRNYWRGFFAACCGATVWRLLGFWVQNDESISALFKTNFSTDYPFDPFELVAFAFIGATCGLGGAAYIKFHRDIVQFFRRHKRISGFFQQNRLVYPTLVTLIITSSSFPPYIGKYTAATLSTHTTIEHLFSNRTWRLGNQDLVAKEILDHWTTPETSFYLHLVLYIVMLFWTSALASTIPTPSGVFIPVLKIGAAYGRLLGELMHAAYPNGIKYSHPAALVPGSYAVVGAAAFSGAVTHTVSTSVILFEMTGQIVHIIPVILGVLISNAVCQSLQPSIYDSIIEIKKLPYLPPIASTNSISHRIVVRDFMNTNIPFVWKHRFTYADLKSLLSAHKKIMSFPLVDSPGSMKLLGSVARPDLLKLLYLHLGRERRLQEVCRRNSDTLSPALQLISTISDRVLQAERTVDGRTNDALEQEARPNALANAQAHQQPVRQTSDRTAQPLRCCDESAAQHLHDDDTLGSRLIVSATWPHNYGATASEALVKKAPRPSSLLAECHTDDDNDRKNNVDHDDDDDGHGLEHTDRVEGVAKIINRYNRGSTMDEDYLDRSHQEIKGRLKEYNESLAEIVLAKIDDNNKQQLVAVTSSELVTGSDYRSKQTGQNVQVVCSAQPLVSARQQFSTIHQPSSPSLSSRPKKSILKTSSLSNVTKKNATPQQQNGAQKGENLTNNLKFSLESMTTTSQTNNNDSGGGAQMVSNSDNQASSKAADFQIGPRQPYRRKVRLPRLRVVDMTPEEQEQWEKDQLSAHVDITKCQIDEAPFQLVEQTSLYRMHTLFSMLGLNHAYVTSFGRLVGIVALKDIRYAIERMLQEK